ncbi:MAG TPA: hypothetical protein VFH15_15580 [Pyrinomonadaceae bacterium]|nr:hypothetical protein [Pyrinomonadaceae bacterium]
MKTPLKTSLIIIGLALLALLVGVAFLVWLVSRPDETDETFAARVSKTSGRPAFEVQVEKPRMDRPFAGILPSVLETKLVGELRFDHASPGARIGSVGHDRLELSAEGWDLLIETDGKGGIAPGTRLVFPIEIAEKKWTLRCRPADRAVGYLQATTRAGSGELDGRFLIELAKCADAATGKILDTEAGGNPGDAWPSEPLTLRGSFAGLPLGRP